MSDEGNASEMLCLMAAILRAGGFDRRAAANEARVLQALLRYGTVEEVARDERF